MKKTAKKSWLLTASSLLVLALCIYLNWADSLVFS
jgi:hypothetical protein